MINLYRTISERWRQVWVDSTFNNLEFDISYKMEHAVDNEIYDQIHDAHILDPIWHPLINYISFD